MCTACGFSSLHWMNVSCTLIRHSLMFDSIDDIDSVWMKILVIISPIPVLPIIAKDMALLPFPWNFTHYAASIGRHVLCVLAIVSISEEGKQFFMIFFVTMIQPDGWIVVRHEIKFGIFWALLHFIHMYRKMRFTNLTTFLESSKGWSVLYVMFMFVIFVNSFVIVKYKCD